MNRAGNYVRKAGGVLVAGSILGALIAGCGGGGSTAGTSGGGTGGGATTSISGTAATGMPIVGNVVAIDAKGNVFSATTSAQGAYTVNVAGGTAPFILSIVGTSAGKTVTLNSVATAANQTVNITPLTDLIVSTAAGQPGATALADLCQPTVTAACTTALTNATTGKNLANAVTAVSAMVAPLNTSNVDPLNGQFAANGTGMDGVLDQIVMTPATGAGTMATVTLISVPTQQLGTVTMPATAGGTSTTATVTPSAATLTVATTGATALSEINACLASLNALYPSTMTTPPSAAQVTPFIDPTFAMGGTGTTMNQAWFIGALTTLSSAGGFAEPGFTVTALGLAAFDFTPQTTAALAQGLQTASPLILNAAGTPTAAWVRIHASGKNGGDETFRMIKGAAYGGCAGGWTVAGTSHIDTGHRARITKFISMPTTFYKREQPFHITTAEAKAEGISKIVFSGPGLAVYSGTSATPVGAATPLTMMMPPVPAAPAVQQGWFGIQGQINVTGSYYMGADGIESCQDLGVAAIAPAGTPCYDDTAVAPGAVYTAEVWNNAATPLVSYAYSFRLDSVPLAKAFVVANDKDLFPQNIVPTPSTVAALNTAAAGVAVGSPIDNIISFNYSMSSVYGGIVDNCNVNLLDSTAASVLYAEVGNASQSSCVFKTAGLNNGSLIKPATAFAGTATNGFVSWMGASGTVLGNSAGVVQPYY